MKNNQITSVEELRQKIESKRYDYFTFPVLDITVKYRKPDLLKLSLNKSLPLFIADAVIESYKEAVGGTDMAEYQQKKLAEGIKADDQLVEDLSKKGYELLSSLCESHAIKDVPESDFDTTPPLIAWKDVPEEDSIAFLLNLINRAQVGTTKSGGEVASEDVTTFPDGERKPKRSTVRKDGQAVRQSAQ